MVLKTSGMKRVTFLGAEAGAQICSIKKGVLKNFAKLTVPEASNFIQKQALAQVLS